jgi:hypothetical protein
MEPHFCQKIAVQWEIRLRSYHRIDPTFRTHRRLASAVFVFVDPFENLGGSKNAETMETTTERAFFDLLSVLTRRLMCDDDVAWKNGGCSAHSFLCQMLQSSQPAGERKAISRLKISPPIRFAAAHVLGGAAILKMSPNHLCQLVKARSVMVAHGCVWKITAGLRWQLEAD